MRARRREINIFNMSLLDILCGALGAFCFMMIVALPYYKPSHSAAELKEQEEKTERLMQEIEKLKEKLSDPSAAQDLEELLRQLRAQIKALEGQVNQLNAENEQLRAEKQQLAAENNQLRQEKQQLEQEKQQLYAENNQLKQEKQQLKDENDRLKQENQELKTRAPFLVLVESYPEVPLDLYLDRVGVKSLKGEENPRFDPTKKAHAVFWDGDLANSTHGVNVWMLRDTPAGSRFKIYVKVDPTSLFIGSVVVDGMVMAPGVPYIPLPKVTLTLPRSWILVGTLTCPEPGKLIFAEATQAEREAEWKALTKATPPPSVTPTPTLTPAPSINPKSRRENLERMIEQLKRQGAPASEVENLEQVLKDMKRREMGSATPAATRPAMPFDEAFTTPSATPSPSPTP